MKLLDEYFSIVLEVAVFEVRIATNFEKPLDEQGPGDLTRVL